MRAACCPAPTGSALDGPDDARSGLQTRPRPGAGPADTSRTWLEAAQQSPHGTADAVQKPPGAPFACPVLARNRVPTETPAILRISTCCRQALGIFGGVPPDRLCGRPLQGRAAPQPSDNLFEYHAEIKQP